MKNFFVTLVLILTVKLIYSQNVGIGTNNPQAKLDVHGNARIDSIPQAANINYLVGVDANGFLLKTPNNQTLSHQENFPDLVGWGYGIVGQTATIKPISFYRSRADKVSIGNNWLYFQTDSSISQARDLTSDWTINVQYMNANAGAVSLGNYLYILIESNFNGEKRVYRYNRLNIAAGGTQMVFTGLTLGYIQPGGPRQAMTSDGTYFYFNYNAGNSANDNIIAKYSLAGTTLQYISSVTRGSIGDFSQTFLVDAAGNYYGASNLGDNLFKKFSPTGTLVYSWRHSQANLMNWLDHFYSSRNNSYNAYERFNK